MNNFTLLKVIFAAAGLLFVHTNLTASEIHKWIGPNGEVHYGSQPPPGYASKSQVMKIKSAPTPEIEEPEESDSTTASSDSQGSQGNENAQNPENMSPEQKAKLAEVEKKNANIRQKNCAIAKRRVAGINQGGRLYEVNEKGERHYWNDSERQSKLAEAQESVNKWCK